MFQVPAQVPAQVDSERPLYFEMTETQILADLSALYTQAYQTKKWRACVQALDAVARMGGLYDPRRREEEAELRWETMDVHTLKAINADMLQMMVNPPAPTTPGVLTGYTEEKIVEAFEHVFQALKGSDDLALQIAIKSKQARMMGLYENRRHFYHVNRRFHTLGLRTRDRLIQEAPQALAKMAAEKVGIFEEAVSKAQKELDPETLRRYIEVGYGAKA